MAETEETVPAFNEASRKVKMTKSILLAAICAGSGLIVGYLMGAVELDVQKESARHPAIKAPARNMPIPTLRPFPVAKTLDCESQAVLCSEWETDHPAKALKALSATLGGDLKKDTYKVRVEVVQLLDTEDILPESAVIPANTGKK